MVHDSYYIIRARPELHELLKDVHVDPEDFVGVMIGPILWSNRYSDRCAFPRADAEKAIKILFMISVIEVVDSNDELRVIRAKVAVDVSSFDKYWSIETMHGVDWNARQFVNTIGEDALRRVVSDQDRVMIMAVAR